MPPPARRPPPQPRAEPVLNMREAGRDTGLQADDQPNRMPDSETQQTMDLQEQPEPFATAPALSYTDLRPPTNTQMSDSLGAAPLAQFAPASLTSTPPKADAGVEAAEMVLGGSQQPGKKRRRKGRTRITRKQFAAKRARSEDHEAPGS